MRVTDKSVFNTTLANIQQYNARLLQTYAEASWAVVCIVLR